MNKRLYLVLVWLLFPTLALAQTGTLSGSVIDLESSSPLPGANVIIVDTNLGAASGLDGSYSIANIPTGTYTVRVTFIGYKQLDQSVTISSGTNTMNFELEPDFTGLEEVVVTGIASATSKARAEVAVSSVKTDKLLEQNAYQDVSQLLNGKIPGVSVQPSSGNVGGGIRFNMRAGTGLNGDGQPIIYVDGVRIDNEEFGGFGAGGQQISMTTNLNPEDIASVEVLKGPAGAALYGTSGSNGVILITTKRGSLSTADRPFSINYKGVLGTNSQFEEYDRSNAGSPDEANAFFRDGRLEQHSISVSGGSPRVRYFTSYDNRFEEGHINNNKQDRQSFRANFEAFPTEKLTVRANAAFVNNEIDRPQNDNNTFGYLGNTLLASSPYVFTDSASIEGLENKQRINQFTGVLEAEFSPIDNLSLRASVGYDGTDLRNDETFPQNLSYSGVNNGQRSILDRRNEQYTYDFNARYSYDITDGLSASTIVGSQSFNRIRRLFFLGRENFSTELITNVDAGADFTDGGETFIHERESGIYVQQEFAFNNWLFATVAGRQDFASAVGAEAPSIFYPKASFAIRIDEIAELPSFIDFFKFRAAYGEAGQLPALLDVSPIRWQAEASGYGAGAVTDAIGNIEIEPERIKEIEAGIELGLLNDRIGIDVTGYFQDAENSIIDFQNAPSSGLTATDVPFNIGAASGWGIETSLLVDVVRQRDYGVDFQLIWSYQENEVDDLGGAQTIFDGFDINGTTVGLPQAAFYTWGSRAVFDETTGEYAGEELTTIDADGDGNPDRAFFGTPYPTHNGSFNLNVRFLRDFTFSGLLDWQLGGSVYNNTQKFSAIFGGFQARNIAAVQLGLVDAADVGLEDENIEVFAVGSAEYREAGEAYARTDWNVSGFATDGNWVQDADFIKLREISLRYDFSNLLRRANVSRYVRSASFTLSARNLWMSSTYGGIDPEVSQSGARDPERAHDFLTLPQPRVVYGTLTIGF